MYRGLKAYVGERLGELDQIPDGRKEDLQKLAAFVQSRQEAGEETKLTFICTHNSRRSHMAQIWAQVAACVSGVPNLRTYSGGTEATAFNPRAVAAMKRAGFQIERETDDRNPIYNVKYSDDAAPMKAFSKVLDEEPNPKKGFGAVMTCSQADKACPSVRGASMRTAISYDDPKASDDTPEETERYDERCRQIAREMLYSFSQVNH